MIHTQQSAAGLATGILFLVVLVAAMGAEATDLTVTVNNLRSDKGEILVELHDDSIKDDFLDSEDNVIEQQKQSATEPVFVFSDLDPGIYSISLFHDENSNQELDTTMFGIPLEGHGFSNNASAPFGPPDFEATAFEVTEANLEMNIDLRHLASRTSGDGTGNQTNDMMQQMMAMFGGSDNGTAMDFTQMGEMIAAAIQDRKGGNRKGGDRKGDGAPVFIGFAFANFCPNDLTRKGNRGTNSQ